MREKERGRERKRKRGKEGNIYKQPPVNTNQIKFFLVIYPDLNHAYIGSVIFA